MENILIQTARFVYRYHRYILVTAGIGAILFAFFISEIKIKSDMMDVMPADNPSMKLFTEILNEFQRKNSLTIVVGSVEGEIERHTEFIEQLAQGIEGSSLIRDADYSFLDLPWEFFFSNFPLYLDEKGLDLLRQKLTVKGIQRQIRKNYRSLTSFLSSPADDRMISEDPLDIRSLFDRSSMKREPPGMDVSSGYYFSKDRTKAFIFATPDGSGRDFLFVSRLKKELEQTARDTLRAYSNRDNLTVEFTGAYAISWEAQESIRRDMLFSVLVTVLLVLFIFRLIYGGGFFGLFAIFLTISMALIITLATAFVLFRGLNLVTALVSAMLIGLGFDYTLHIFDRYIVEFRKRGTSLGALETTFANTGKSIVTSAVTTSFAFFSIVITSFRGLHELGIIAGTGIIACMISSLIILGALLVLLSAKKSGALLLQRERPLLEVVVPDFIFRHGKVLLASVCTIIIVLSSGAGKLTFTSDISSIGLKHSRALELQKSLFEQAGSKGMPLILTYKGEDDFNRVLDIMEQTLNGWMSKEMIGEYMSLSSIIPTPGNQQSAIRRLQGIKNLPENIEKVFLSALEGNGFAVEDRNISYIRKIVSALHISSSVGVNDLPESLKSGADMFYNREKGRVAAYIYPSDEQWEEEGMAFLERSVHDMDKGWQLTGWQLLQHDLEMSIIRESLTAALLSFIFILLMLYLHFRKASVVFLVQLPLLFGMLITLGVMGYAGISFNYVNISAIAIIFGISVDYGVYFMQSFLERENPEDDMLIRHAFKNIVICSLTTMAGFGSLVFTSFRGISSLGQVIITGIVSCLILSAALLPVSDRLLKSELNDYRKGRSNHLI